MKEHFNNQLIWKQTDYIIKEINEIKIKNILLGICLLYVLVLVKYELGIGIIQVNY